MTLLQFFQQSYIERRYLSDATVLTYQATINRFQQWYGEPVLLAALTHDMVRSFLRDYRENNTPASVNGKRQVLLTLWRWAHRWKMIEHKPPEDWEVPKLPAPQHAPKAWTMGQFGRILDSCGAARVITSKGVTWDERHWRALLLVIYDTGERLHALLSAERADLSGSGHLTIRGEHRKGQKRDIVRKLHSDTLAAIADLPPHRLLFPWPLSKRAIWREVEPIMEAAGIPLNRRNKFHCGRRTSATQVAVALGAAAAQRHLDHSSIALTMNSYIDVSQLPGNDVTESMPRPGM